MVFGDLCGYISIGTEVDVIDTKTNSILSVFSADELVPLNSSYRFRTVDKITVEDNVLKIYLNKY